jgi:hypothetical protein
MVFHEAADQQRKSSPDKAYAGSPPAPRSSRKSTDAPARDEMILKPLKRQWAGVTG